MSRSLVLRIFIIVLALQFPSLARAAGQPVLGSSLPSASLTSLDGGHRYYARPHARQTVIRDVSPTGTLIHAIPGRFAIPLVAYDGSLGGLSANGHVLVLSRPRTTFPERSSEFALVDASTLRLVRVAHLRGDYAFDAISADGAWVYLIEYSPTDATNYRVRALDARNGRLVPHDIVDPHDRGEKMQGYPLSRVTSPNGRWAYTLYNGVDRPFIHALDTTHLRARCIDLPAFPRRVQPFAVRLRVAGHRLVVAIGRRVLTALDTRTLRPTSQPVGPHTAGAASSVPPLAALAAILLAAGAAAVLRRRMRGLTRAGS
jgi:hypothetical protein